jgi:ZipA, C-terminal FtsZ-binding domain
MSTLQVTLAIIGGLVLAGVVAQGAWASRKNKPMQADAKSKTQTTMAMGMEHERAEPMLEGSFEQGYTSQSGPRSHDGLIHKDVLAEGDARSSSEFPQGLENQPQDPLGHEGLDFEVTQSVVQSEKRYALDALIDVIANIELDGDSVVYGEAALAAMPPSRRIGTKPFTVEGLNAHRGEWEPIKAGQRYSAFQAGIQLANRLGALNEIEFSEFVMVTQRFTDAVSGEAEFTDMIEEVARARELDHFASEHDAQLIFQIHAQRLAWSPGFVQQHASQLGFVAGVIPGRMVIAAKALGLPPILGLSFDTQAALAEDPSNSAIRVLSLTLDVPQVDQSDEPFRRMWFVAQELAKNMEGTIMDDQGYVLSSTVLGNIEQDLLALYKVLASRDLAAGSPQARRLFS